MRRRRGQVQQEVVDVAIDPRATVGLGERQQVSIQANVSSPARRRRRIDHVVIIAQDRWG